MQAYKTLQEYKEKERQKQSQQSKLKRLCPSYRLKEKYWNRNNRKKQKDTEPINLKIRVLEIY